MVLRLGVNLPAACDFADFDAAVVGLVRRDEQIERGADFRFFGAEGFRELVERGGLVGRVNDGFKCGLEFPVASLSCAFIATISLDLSRAMLRTS